MRILNLGKVSKVPKLDEKKAIDTGSQVRNNQLISLLFWYLNTFGFTQLLSEFILLSVGSVLLIYEYLRQSEKEEAKQAVIEQEKDDLRNRVEDLTFSVEQLSTQTRELSRVVVALSDDLEKANQKNSGFMGLGGGNGTKSPADLKEVNFHNKPITRAVEKLNLTSA